MAAAICIWVLMTKYKTHLKRLLFVFVQQTLPKELKHDQLNKTHDFGGHVDSLYGIRSFVTIVFSVNSYFFRTFSYLILRKT